MSENETNLVHGEKTPDTKPTETVFCTNCGAKNDKTNTKCLSCNEDLNKSTSPSNTQGYATNMASSTPFNNQAIINGPLDLVEKNQIYYERVFSLISSGLNKFNWCAFFLGLPYFLYRKMTKKYLLAIFLPMIISILTTIIFISTFVSSIFYGVGVFSMSILGILTITNIILPLAVMIYMGVTFNKKYYMHLNSLVQNQNVSPAVLREYTGVSPKRMWICIIIYVIYLYLNFSIYF